MATCKSKYVCELLFTIVFTEIDLQLNHASANPSNVVLARWSTVGCVLLLSSNLKTLDFILQSALYSSVNNTHSIQYNMYHTLI